jgi:hypothetical protein
MDVGETGAQPRAVQTLIYGLFEKTGDVACQFAEENAYSFQDILVDTTITLKFGQKISNAHSGAISTKFRVNLLTGVVRNCELHTSGCK